MPRKVAILKFNSLADSKVDREKGIVFGVQLAKLGKKATFRDLDGKKVSIDITPRVVDGLLALFSAEEQITSHWTHNWIESGDDGLLSKVASFRNFRKDDNGDLLADAFLWPTTHKEAIMHAAENDPTGMMVSTVFDYTGGEKDAVPTRVQAADFVEAGAATVALCAKLSADDSTTNSTMDISELITMLSDPKVKDALKAIIKSVEANEPDPADDQAASDLETEAGVMEADKKPEDDAKPALMRAQLRVGRAIRRQTAELAKNETAILAKAKTQAEAAATSVIGKGAIIKQGEDVKPNDIETAINAEIAAGKSKNRATALLSIARKNPKLYNEALSTGKI